MGAKSGRRERLAAAAIAAVVGLVVFVLATELFPYHSSNHDEGVYLQQAAMVLDGRLFLYPGDLVDRFRPWFFVVDGGETTRMYSKYSPVPAAIYALSYAITGSYDPALPVVAIAIVAGCYALTASAFDRRTALLAAAILAAAPLFLIVSSLFLSYAPTAALNLAFAVAYVRAARTGRIRWALAAGVAIGLAFFARPYTALLFALPFVGHALATLVAGWRRDRLAPPLVRNAAVAVPGVAFVGVTLGYNALVTGDPLLFPYEAFAPRDGIGFGERRILGHAAEYTVAVALEANAYVLRELAVRWFAAGPVGTAFALVGLAVCVRGNRPAVGPTGMSDREVRIVLAGVLASVVVGNLAFWGNMNVLATFDDPTDGLVSQFGPFYHFDALVPLSAFAAAGAVAAWERLRAAVTARTDGRTARIALALALVLALATVGVAQAAALGPPVERNAAFTEKFERAYEPVDREFDDALVFLPTPYGEWQNHPFQYLRNDPGFDGDVVYALDGSPSERFAVIDEYPDRTHYRYTYRGRWEPTPRQVEPVLQPIGVREGAELAATTTMGVPRGSTSAHVRIETERGIVTRTVDPAALDETIAVEWTLDGEAVGFDAPATDGESAPLTNGTSEVTFLATFAQPDGATVTYRATVTVEVSGDRVRAIWPPETRVCRLTTDCGREGTFVPGADDHVTGVDVEHAMEEQDRERGAEGG